jgi:hypothetical protein
VVCSLKPTGVIVAERLKASRVHASSGTIIACYPNMKTSTITESTTSAPISVRRILYGLGLVIALSFLYASRLTNESQSYIILCLSIATLSLLILFGAGVEYAIRQVQTIVAQATQRTTREQADQATEDRQRAFNHIWQSLIDSRNENVVSSAVLQDLSTLFRADLVAIWSADKADGYMLIGTGELVQEHRMRLEKVTQTSPCFASLRKQQHVLVINDIEHQTTIPFAWFCEEMKFQQVVLCPVLVCKNVVGVLGFFYRENQCFTSQQREEMQLAANLFLCAI